MQNSLSKTFLYYRILQYVPTLPAYLSINEPILCQRNEMGFSSSKSINQEIHTPHVVYIRRNPYTPPPTLEIRPAPPTLHVRDNSLACNCILRFFFLILLGFWDGSSEWCRILGFFFCFDDLGGLLRGLGPSWGCSCCDELEGSMRLGCIGVCSCCSDMEALFTGLGCSWGCSCCNGLEGSMKVGCFCDCSCCND